MGRKAQAGGAIAIFIGVLLRFLGPSPTPGIPLDPYKLDYLFIAIGLFLVLSGTIARLLLLDGRLKFERGEWPLQWRTPRCSIESQTDGPILSLST
jgi:hypothetical protein